MVHLILACTVYMETMAVGRRMFDMIDKLISGSLGLPAVGKPVSIARPCKISVYVSKYSNSQRNKIYIRTVLFCLFHDHCRDVHGLPHRGQQERPYQFTSKRKMEYSVEV
jgi:hypothetical protein